MKLVRVEGEGGGRVRVRVREKVETRGIRGRVRRLGFRVGFGFVFDGAGWRL